LFKINIILRRD